MAEDIDRTKQWTDTEKLSRRGRGTIDWLIPGESSIFIFGPLPTPKEHFDESWEFGSWCQSQITGNYDTWSNTFQVGIMMYQVALLSRAYASL